MILTTKVSSQGRHLALSIESQRKEFSQPARIQARHSLVGRWLHLGLVGAMVLLVGTPLVVEAADCANTSVGFIPIDDLGTGTYLDLRGGLYAGGSNQRPSAHEAAGLSLAREIVPLDEKGNPDANGKYVLLSIGMSNPSQEFSNFVRTAAGDPEINPDLVLVNGAESGQVASIISNPEVPFWSNVEDKLAAARVSAKQVAAVWLKIANVATELPTSEDYREELLQGMEAITRILHDRYPNLRLVYFSSRIYAGYASTALNPEPYAYESGYVVKRIIEKQIGGDSRLNFDPSAGVVNVPWFSWGPYLWADGLVPRSDGTTWECRALEEDGTHPSLLGEQQVADMLLEFFKTDSTAVEWFLADPPTLDTLPPAPPRDFVVE